MNLYRYLVLFLFVFPGFRLAAQDTQSLTVTGMVNDSLGQSLPFATVKMLDKKNNPLVTGITGEDGTFTISFKNRDTVAAIVVSIIGFENKNIPVDHISRDSLDMGTVILKQSGSQLETVKVNAKIPLIKQQPGRLEYNLQADPDSKVKNMLEMMKKMPYLSVDANENILFKGSGNFKIFINGKPSGMLENNPSEVLKSIPANTIQRIEIITNPSAKYDAEGISGIVNIITTKKMKNGYSGSVNVNTRFPAGGAGTGSSFSAKAGKLGVSAFGGINTGRNPGTNYHNSQQTSVTRLFQKGRQSSKYNGAYFGTNLSYELDSLNLFTLQFNGNIRSSKRSDDQNSTLVDNGLMQENYNVQNNGQSDGNGMDISFNYQLGFPRDKKKLLTFSYRYLQYNNDVDNSVTVTDLQAPGTNHYRQTNDNGNKEHTLQLDWVQNIHAINFETGVKGIFRKNNSLFPGDVSGSNANEFFNTQNILGIYSSLRFNLKGWDFQTGARVEKTFTDIDFTSTQTKVDRDYVNLIPNLSISKGWKDKHSIGFGFSQRIKRPGVNRLNPFTDRSNPYFENSGNPYLQPVVNNDVMMNYSYNKKIFLNIGLSYSFSNKIDLRVSVYDPATNITKNTYENSSKARRLGIDYNLNYPVTKKMNITLNGNFAQFFIEGYADAALVSNDLFTYNLSASANYQFEKNWQVNAGLDINSRNPAGLQNFTNGFASSSFSVSKTLFKKKCSLSAFANNPFSKMREIKTITIGKNFIQDNVNEVYFRSFGCSINYKFGSGKDAVKNTKRNIRNNDVAN